jgi:hypothetical protein
MEIVDLGAATGERANDEHISHCFLGYLMLLQLQRFYSIECNANIIIQVMKDLEGNS